jgi:hypothetical protein
MFYLCDFHYGTEAKLSCRTYHPIDVRTALMHNSGMFSFDTRKYMDNYRDCMVSFVRGQSMTVFTTEALVL